MLPHVAPGVVHCRFVAVPRHRNPCSAFAATAPIVSSLLRDLMAVAYAGLIMPPKSTWFEPKLADGMVSHMLD